MSVFDVEGIESRARHFKIDPQNKREIIFDKESDRFNFSMASSGLPLLWYMEGSGVGTRVGYQTEEAAKKSLDILELQEKKK